MWPFKKKKEPQYKIDWDKVKTIHDVNIISKVFFADKLFKQKAIEDFPEIEKYLIIKEK